LEYNEWGLNFNTNLYTAQRLRIHGAIPLPPIIRIHRVALNLATGHHFDLCVYRPYRPIIWSAENGAILSAATSK
jgi:hypothetical protein